MSQGANRRVVVAMSGGVDSSTAAALLRLASGVAGRGLALTAPHLAAGALWVHRTSLWEILR